MSEHYLQSFSRLLDCVVNENRAMAGKSPAEAIDRVDATYEAVNAMRLEPNQMTALLAIAIDRLAMREAGAIG